MSHRFLIQTILDFLKRDAAPGHLDAQLGGRLYQLSVPSGTPRPHLLINFAEGRIQSYFSAPADTLAMVRMTLTGERDLGLDALLQDHEQLVSQLHQQVLPVDSARSLSLWLMRVESPEVQDLTLCLSSLWEVRLT